MVKITLLSDTHGYLDDRILHYCAEADEIWHAGDIGTEDVIDQLEAITTFRGVYGNIDGQKIRVRCPLHQRFMCEDVDVWITHIGGYPGRYDRKVREEIYRNPPKLFICGHSHILKVMPDKKLGLLHMNPGAAGINGFHKIRTLLQFEISGDNIENLRVVELGKRG